MKHIVLNDSLIPRCLARAQLDYANWDAFSQSAAGRELRQLKSDEQQGFCGYCECRLAEASGNLPLGAAHLDHFYQKNRCPEKMYAWDNLILSCKQNDSCGFFKDRQPIPSEQLLNPLEDNPRDYFDYTLIGDKCEIRISPMATLPEDKRQKAQNTIDALNLNCDRLCQARTWEWFKYREETECIFEMQGQMEDCELAAYRAELEQQMEHGSYSSAMVCLAHDTW